MGYYRPVSEFNIGKKGEFKERINFTIGQESAIYKEGIDHAR